MRLSIAAGLALGTALAGTAGAQEIRFMCYSDGNECEVLDEMLGRLEADNPGLDVVVDTVAYQAVLETLPVQLEAGNGPDIAKVTDLGGLSEYYLDLSPYVDAAQWEAAFGEFLDWYRPAGDEDGIYGMHSQLTITGGYANKTLFEQAGVEMPGADATWDDWAEASRQVAEATGTPFPMAMDRSGHRIAGPAISAGARMFDDAGEAILVDAGFTDFVEKFVGWHEDGTMAPEVWGASGGTTYQDAAQEFINGQLVFYYSGSWQTQRMADSVGDAFDWQVVGTPCGAAACSGMPGGAGIVGFKDTEHPEAVAKVIDFLAQEENYRELAARTLNIPAHAAVAEGGVDFQTESEAAKAALTAWAGEVADLSPVAFAYQGYAGNRAMYNITVERVSQALTGELSVEDAMARAKDDLAKAMAETGN